MTLFSAAVELFRQGRPFLAVIVGSVFFVLPGLYLLGVGAVSWGLAKPDEKRVDGRFARIVFHLKNWSMPDVFLVGVLVSLIKIATIARIEYGASFWAFALFSIAFVTTAGTVDERRIVDKLSRHG